MYQVCFYVPVTHLEKVKEALFNAGAGKLGNYKNCSWESLGKGQFKPTTNSKAFIGTLDKLEVLDEYKVEMICKKKNIHHVLMTLLETHPYETPAYFVTELLTIDDFNSTPLST